MRSGAQGADILSVLSLYANNFITATIYFTSWQPGSIVSDTVTHKYIQHCHGGRGGTLTLMLLLHNSVESCVITLLGYTLRTAKTTSLRQDTTGQNAKWGFGVHVTGSCYR